MDKIVVVPAYKPDIKMLSFIDSLINLDMKVVVIDDGSGIEYERIFQKLNKNAKYISYPINKGKGYALKVGFQYIKDNYKDYIVITADSDGQHNVVDIYKISKLYYNNRGTLLLGVRNFNSSNTPLKSKVGNIVTRKVLSTIIKQDLMDTQTGLRAFDNSLIDLMLEIDGDRYEYETNVLLECSKNNIKINEEEIMTIYQNNNKGSHYKPLKDSLIIFKQIIKFGSSSFISFLIDYSLYIILLQLTNSWQLALSVSLSNILARIISSSFNFYINKKIIFKSEQNMAKSAISYFFLAILIIVANTIFLNILINNIGVSVYTGKIISELSFFIVSYIVQKNIIFKKKRKINYEKTYPNY